MDEDNRNGAKKELKMSTGNNFSSDHLPLRDMKDKAERGKEKGCVNSMVTAKRELVRVELYLALCRGNITLFPKVYPILYMEDTDPSF